MGQHRATRIGAGGFQHETNTFAPTPARFADFARGGGWPALSRGAALAPAVAGINLPIAGFLDAVLHAAGGAPGDIVEVAIFRTDIADRARIDSLRIVYFGGRQPA